MFFFAILGIEDKEKEIRDIKNIVCKACGRMSSYKLIKLFSVFHLFFIPLFTWNERYYLVSRCCNTTYEVSPEIGKKLEKGIDVPLNDWNLRIINTPSICPNCRNNVDPSFEYCPHCGQKLR